jgi:ankyrin repeat protein
MHAAAAGGQLVALKMLKDQGGDLECGSSEGKSVLHQAVRSNQVCIVAYLLENRVSGKTGKGFQETPLHVAAESNHHECARLLLEDNVLVDAMRGETNKETALHIAAANGYRETVSLLLTHDASPDNRNKRKESALHLAAKTHSIPVMQLLMNRGCDVDARDCDGRTPLHFAVNSKEKGGGECILLLSKKQAILDLRDGHGMTALHSAAFGRRYNRVRLLIKEGADLCVKNDLGKSALNFVMKYTPSCIRTIEERLDSGIKIDWTPPPDCDDASQYSNIVQMDFNIVIPSACRSGQSADSDVRLFHELLKINSNDPARLEKILMHPLSLCFLHLKWQQIRVLYYFLLLSHFIYSMTYSGYVVLLYATLCKPIEWMVDVDDLDVVGRFKLNMTCDLNVGGTKWGPGVNYVVALWSVLLFFTLLYLGKEVTKFLHLRKK